MEPTRVKLEPSETLAKLINETNFIKLEIKSESLNFEQDTYEPTDDFAEDCDDELPESEKLLNTSLIVPKIEEIDLKEETIILPPKPASAGNTLSTNLDEKHKNKSTASSKELNKPEIRKIAKGQYRCHYCDKTISYKTNLSRHIKYIHENKDNAYECDYCKKTFSEKRNLGLHMGNIHLAAENPYKCKICDKRFSTLNFLLRHIEKSNHQTPKCQFCNKQFAKRYALKKHIKLVHYKIKESVENRPSNVISQENQKCTICEKSFSSMHNLKKHNLIHTGEKSFQCFHCNQRFSRKCILSLHVIRHLTVMPHSCHICEKGFVRKSQLNTHLKRHSEGKVFPKNVSPKDTIFKNFAIFNNTRSNNLKQFIIIENKETLYQCPLCQKNYKHAGSLSNHMKTAHGPKN